MYAAAGVGKAKFVWRVWEHCYEMGDEWAVLDLRLYWGKWTREWKVMAEWDRPTWYTNVRLRFYRVVNDKREGWELQGPVRRIY